MGVVGKGRFALCALGFAAAGFVSLGSSSCNNGSSTVQLTILHTNDIHSRFDAAVPGTEDNPYSLGGLARLKTVIDQERAKYPNSLLLDGGDWSEAGIYYLVDAGRNVLRIMDALGYDATVVGNHDFLNGPSELANRVTDVNPHMKVLACNMDLSALSQAESARIHNAVPDYAIFTVAGIKIAVIGATTDAPEYLSYFQPGVIDAAAPTASTVATTIHNQKLADIIIVLSHNHIAENVTLAQNVPYISLVVSGHDHTQTPTPRIVQNAGTPVYVVEASAWGKYLGEMVFNVNTQNRTLTMASYQLIPIEPTTAQNATIVSDVQAEMQKVDTRFGYDVFDDQVGSAPEGLPQNSVANSPLGTMMAESYREAAHTDVGVEIASLIATGVQPGPLSSRNLFEVVPYIFSPIPNQAFPQFGSTWTVHVVSLSGNDLLGLFNMATSLPSLLPSLGEGWVSVSGAKITYSPSNKLSPVTGVQILNQVTGAYENLDTSKTYTIALNDGLLRALGLFDVTFPNVTDTGINTWQALKALTQARGTLLPSEFAPNNIFIPTTGDLALDYSNVSFEKTATGYNIHTLLTNVGQSATTPMSLNIQRSVKPDNPLGELDPTQFVNVNANVAIPALQPGAGMDAVMQWTTGLTPGIYSLQLNLVGTDAQSLNNNLSMHFKVQ